MRVNCNIGQKTSRCFDRSRNRNTLQYHIFLTCIYPIKNIDIFKLMNLNLNDFQLKFYFSEQNNSFTNITIFEMGTRNICCAPTKYNHSKSYFL